MSKIIPFLLVTFLLNSCSTKKMIYVADTFADCADATKQKCLNIKENKADDWIVIHNTIEGFEYKEGYTHKIEVEITKVKNPPVDGNNLKYTLAKIIYQEKSKTVAKMQNIDGDWKVSKLVGVDSLHISPTLKINLDTQKIAGNAGCNSFGATFFIDGEKLTFKNPVKTKMYCSNMNIENAFFECLAKTASYQTLNNELILYTEDGKKLLSCSKAE